MHTYVSLQELLACDPQSRQLYDGLTVDQQVALQEQRQDIRTREALQQYATAAQKQSDR